MAVLSRIAIAASVFALFSQAQGAAIQRRESPGCGTEHDFVGDTRQFTIESSGGERVYHVHLPDDYEPGQEKPLLIAYHGRGSEPLDFQHLTRFSDPEINPGMITVFPAGVGNSWEGPTYAEPGVSDLQFTTDLIQRLKDDFCIDVARIYAAGYSNGGGFVNTLACDAYAGAQFAAFASVAGAYYTDAVDNEGCSPSRSPLPIFHSHGTGDTVVPYEGGPGAGGDLPAIPEWLSRWSDRNKCGPVDSVDLPDGVTEDTYTCDGQPDYLHHIRLDGHGHGYPVIADQVDISPEIVEFLSSKTHPDPLSRGDSC